jgi:hypothetical protein
VAQRDRINAYQIDEERTLTQSVGFVVIFGSNTETRASRRADEVSSCRLGPKIRGIIEDNTLLTLLK